MFQPVERASRAFERVVAQIEGAIYSGQLRPGDHLPSERALVDEFQVGRSTVREALRVLESMGLLRTQPGSPRGPRVAPSNTAGLEKIMSSVVRIEQISLVDLVQYRMIAGSVSNFLAARLRTEDHLSDMAAAIAAMESAEPEDTERFAQSDVRFHAVIADAAANSFLNIVGAVINQVIVDLVANTLEDAENQEQVRGDFVQLHRELYEAIEARNGGRAAALARTSLYEVYGRLLDVADREKLELMLSADSPLA